MTLKLKSPIQTTTASLTVAFARIEIANDKTPLVIVMGWAPSDEDGNPTGPTTSIRLSTANTAAIDKRIPGGLRLLLVDALQTHLDEPTPAPRAQPKPPAAAPASDKPATVPPPAPSTRDASGPSSVGSSRGGRAKPGL
jgi:hypothetical protein